MSTPIVAAIHPKKVNLNKGEDYYFCTCGQSSNQPFFDGSHTGTDFKPKSFKAETSGETYLCQCKYTANAPFCDGTHKQFDEAQIGIPGPLIDTDASTVPAAKATREEPTVELIHQLAREGLSVVGHHGPMTSMGVPRHTLPQWDDLQIIVAQMARKPLMESEPASTELVIGPEAKSPLKLDIPLFVSDMSFGALSEEAKVSLAKGPKWLATAYALVRAACYPKNNKLIHGIFMS